MKAKEIRSLIEKTNKELLEAVKKENLDLAKEKRSEIKKLTEDLEKAETDEADEAEKRNLQTQKKNKVREEVNKEKRSYANAVKELATGKTISTRAIQVSGGSTEAVIPEEFLNDLETLEAGYGSLEQYCEVIPVTSLTGKRPVSELSGKLNKLTPGQKIPEGALEFSQIQYDCEGYGELVAVDRQLDEDSAVDLFGVIKENFVVKSVNTKNELILAQVEANKESTTISLADGEVVDLICAAIDNYKPSVRRFVKILATSSLRSKLKNAKASDGHRDDRITVENGKVFIDGHEVVEYDSTLGDADALGYVVPMKAIKFFKRKAIEIATSNEAFFDSNAQAIRVVERLDVKALDKAILKSKKITA